MRATPVNQQGTRRERLQAFGRFLWQRFLDDKCFETAGALSYTTLFAVVPLLTAVVAILAVFPAFANLRQHVSDFIFRNFVPASGETVQGYLFQFADNASKLTIVGILFLLASALMMLASIEDRFNRIWRVPTRRKGVARFLLYWAVLTLGPLALVIADIDRFKAVNDRFGHHLGDIALQRFSAHVSSVIRGCDLFGRLGGEEFVLILPDTGDRAAFEAIERIRAGFAAAVPEFGPDYRITASFGIAVLAGRYDMLAEMMQRADTALYRSKMEGRDRVTLAPSGFLPTEPEPQTEFDYGSMPRRAAG